MLHPDPRAELRSLASDLDRLADSSRSGDGSAAKPAPWRGRGGGPGGGPSRGYPGSHARGAGMYDIDDMDHVDHAEGVDDVDLDTHVIDPRGGRRPGPAEAPEQTPVFVDATGHRRKVARRLSIAAVAVLAGYGGLVAVSFAGGPIPPGALLPVPGLPAARGPATTAPANAPADAGSPDATGHGAKGTGPDRAGGQPTGAGPGASPTAKQTTVPVPSGTASASGSATTSPTKNGNTPSNPHKHTRPSP